MDNVIKDKIGFDFKELNHEFAFLKGQDIVYLSGSIIESCVSPHSENMGNRLSDIDIFIITDNYDVAPYTYIDVCKKTFFLNFQDKNLDIEVYDKKNILSLFNSINACDFSIGQYTRNLIQVDGVSFYEYASMIHRLLNGFSTFNENEFTRLKNLIVKDNYFRLLKRLAINIIDNQYDDVVGNLENGNYEVALYITRNILIQSIKVFLLSNNISLDRDKWILFKLKNFAKISEEARLIQQQFNNLYLCELKDDKSIKPNINKSLDFSNQLIVAATEKTGF